MLFARGQREHEPALSVPVRGLADQPSRHLSLEIFARRDHAAIRPTEAQWHTERLRFHCDDVSFTRRLDDPQRNRFCNRYHQHRSLPVGDFRNGSHVFDRPKEIRRLNQDASRIGRNRFFQRLSINPATFVE